MLQGLSTVTFFATDLEAARRWYSGFLGVDAYFERPGYVEFRIGDSEDELGIIDSRYAPHPAATTPSGAVVYWHVDDVAVTLAELLAIGATEHQGVTVRGEGFVTASVVDPFGNVLGVMYNSHYVQQAAARRSD